VDLDHRFDPDTDPDPDPDLKWMDTQFHVGSDFAPRVQNN